MTTMDKPMSPAQGRNRNLDAVKLMSCLAVIGLHTMYHFDSVFSSVLYQLFIFAVPCFYMASGYLLLGKRSVSWGYVGKKLLGIARLVAIWCTVVYAAKLLGMKNGNAWEFLRSYISGSVKSVLQKGEMWHFWYLGTLGLVYLLLPLMNRLLGTEGEQRVRRLTVGWVVLLLICTALQTVSVLLGRSLQNLVPQTFRLWTTLQYFLLGALVREYSGQIRDKLPLKMHVLLAAGTAVVTLLWRLFMDSRLGWDIAELYYDDPFTILWIGLFFSVLMRAELGSNISRAVNRAAPLIMGVYVIHVPVRNLIRDTFVIVGDGGMLLYAFAVTGISFAIAYFVSKLPCSKHLLQI